MGWGQRNQVTKKEKQKEKKNEKKRERERERLLAAGEKQQKLMETKHFFHAKL